MEVCSFLGNKRNLWIGIVIMHIIVSLMVQSGFFIHRTTSKYFWNNICEWLYTRYSRQLKCCTQFVPQNLAGGQWYCIYFAEKEAISKPYINLDSHLENRNWFLSPLLQGSVVFSISQDWQDLCVFPTFSFSALFGICYLRYLLWPK